MKNKIIAIILVIAGILDQSTDLFVMLFDELNLQNWVLTTFRILVISLGAFKLYLMNNKNKLDAQ